jgi:hypothetical protein
MRMKLACCSLIAACAVAACADPTHDRAVEALGGEAPGVPEGPLHRPGQPCVVCHGESGPAEGQFSLAGTVYSLLLESEVAPSVQVELRDINGREFFATTNAAGNFWVRTSEWQPVYPVQTSVRRGELTKQMTTYIARAPSCADCHVDPPGRNSPGHVYLAASRPELEGRAP